MAQGRPLEFDPDQALDVAMRLFWRKGYEATSLQGLLKTMGISKSSFYQMFGSKRLLFERCLVLYRQRLTGELRTQAAAASSGMAFIAASFYEIADEVEDARMGCLLMNTASEFAQQDPDISKLVSDGVESLTQIFQDAVVRAQAEGDVGPNGSPRAIATFIVSSTAGMKNMVKAGMGPQAVKEVAGVALTSLT